MSIAEAFPRLHFVIILGTGNALVAEVAIIAVAVFTLVAFVFNLAVCAATHTHSSHSVVGALEMGRTGAAIAAWK